MLIQVPSDLGSLNLKNHTDQNVNEVCIFRDIVFVILFPIQVLCFEIVTLKAKQAIPFSISTSPRFPPFSALFSLLFSASFALKHDTEGIQGLSFWINYLAHPGNMPVSTHGVSRYQSSLRVVFFFFPYCMIPRLSVSFPQLTFHDSFVYLANSYWVPSMYHTCPRCWREQRLNRAEILALI